MTRNINNEYPRDSNLNAVKGRQPTPRTPTAEFQDTMLLFGEFERGLPVTDPMVNAEDPPLVGRELPNDPEPPQEEIVPPGEDVLDLGDIPMDPMDEIDEVFR
jgi:hypothetical protein